MLMVVAATKFLLGSFCEVARRVCKLSYRQTCAWLRYHQSRSINQYKRARSRQFVLLPRGSHHTGAAVWSMKLSTMASLNPPPPATSQMKCCDGWYASSSRGGGEGCLIDH